MAVVAFSDVSIEQDHAIEEVALAARGVAMRMLITDASGAAVERLARRIHAASARAARPFVLVAAATLPIDDAVLQETCAELLDTVRGGSLLLTDVEQMPAAIQNGFMDTFGCLEAALEPTGRARLMAGTTTSLYDCIAGGTFAERLFYRLNIIHLVGTPSRDARSSAVQSASLMG